MPRGRRPSSPADTVVPEDAVLKVLPTTTPRHIARQRIIEARRERVAHYMMLGHTEAAIALVIGVAPSVVHYDVAAIREQWQKSTVDNVAQAAVVDVARLEYIIGGLLEKSLYDYKAADACLKAIHQKSVILGYSSGVTFDLEAYIRQVAVENGYDEEHAVQVAARISISLK